MGLIVLARHGDAAATRNKLHGNTNDSLTREGRESSYKLAENIAQYDPEVIYTSPVKRCVETAKIIAHELNIPMEKCNELECLDLGKLINQPIDKNMDTVKYYLNHPNEAFPDGESIEDFAERYLPFFEDAFDSNEDSVFVTHGRNILLTKGYIKKGAMAPDFDKSVLTDNDSTTDHAGYAIAEPPDKFKIVTPKKVAHGRS